MMNFLRKLKRSMVKSPLSPLFKVLYDAVMIVHYRIKRIRWKLQGHGLPTKEQAADVAENVTFIFKSFERQRLAKRLYRNIQRFYPGTRVIIADDSKKPLRLKGKHVQVVQLPFNVGLSYGMNRALAEVKTPFTVRIDDDKLLTPFSNIHGQLAFLKQHTEADLSAVQVCNFPFSPKPRQSAKKLLRFSMIEAPRPLLIPHKTKLDDTHYVFGKTQNTFLIRTDKFREIGYDDNIRLAEHYEFFYRAAGVLVSAADIDAFVMHYHNHFNKSYNNYRADYEESIEYIKKKHNLK